MASIQHGSYAFHDTLKGIHFGPGSLESALPHLLRTLGGTKALIVTGKSLREKVRIVLPLQIASRQSIASKDKRC